MTKAKPVADAARNTRNSSANRSAGLMESAPPV